MKHLQHRTGICKDVITAYQHIAPAPALLQRHELLIRDGAVGAFRELPELLLGGRLSRKNLPGEAQKQQTVLWKIEYIELFMKAQNPAA